MSKFYLTFGQKSPAKNGYILVLANSSQEARHMVVEAYGQAWAMLYDEKDFDAECFPAGCLSVLKR